MTNFFEKYQGYILAVVAQVGTGIVIAVRLNNRVRDLERRVRDLSEDLAAERKARAIDISEIKECMKADIECMKADIEGVCDELRLMNQNIAGMREGYAEIVGFFRGQGFKIRGGRMRKIGFNSQRDNFDFDGKFKGYQQCFATSAWMFMSFFSELFRADDDKQLSRYVDDVCNEVGETGIGEEEAKLSLRSNSWTPSLSASIR